MILLATLRNEENAYGVSIAREIEQTAGHRVLLAAVYTALDRLEDDGLVPSGIGSDASAWWASETVLQGDRAWHCTDSADPARLGVVVDGPPSIEGQTGMSIRQPPRLAVWLLTRLSVERQTLAGDLLEEFYDGRSRWWFWHQVLSAVAMDLMRKRTPCTLGLADEDTESRPRASRVAVRESSRYLSHTQVLFVRGCVLLGVGAYGIYYLPLVMWRLMAWLSLWSLLGGVACGIALVLFRNHRQTTRLDPRADGTRIP